MNYEIIVDSLSAAAAERGYHVHHGAEFRMAANVKKFPALWILPLEMSEKTGRGEGFITYRAGVYCLVGEREADPGTADRIAGDIVRISEGLVRDERVVSAELVEVIPVDKILTVNAAVVFRVELRIVTVYFNDGRDDEN